MVNRVVSRENKQAIVCGLQWMPLLEIKHQAREIRARANEIDAARVVVRKAKSTEMTGVGYYMANEDDSIDHATGKTIKDKAVHSLAAIMCNIVGESNAVVAYTLPDGANAVLIVIDAGVPNMDQIKSIEVTQAAVHQYVSGKAGAQYPLWTNDLGNFDGGQLFELADLWAHAGVDTTLVSPPLNVVKIVVVGMILALLAAGAFGWKSYNAKRVAQERARQQELADPVPPYLADVATKINAVGWSASQVLELSKRLESDPVVISGWYLTSVRCEATTAECAQTWERAGGTLDMLKRSVTQWEMVPTSDLSRVVFKRKVEVAPSGFGSRESLPDRAVWQASLLPMLQVLNNAGVNLVQSEQTHLWPTQVVVSGGQVPDSVAIRMAPATVAASAVMVQDVMRALPANYFFNDVELQVDVVARDVMSAYRINAKGGAYVK